jgi:hypothetical protein
MEEKTKISKLQQIGAAEFDGTLVEKLANRPNSAIAYGGIGGLTPADLKKRFDASSRILKAKVDEIIAALQDGDALDSILVEVDGKTISAKQWITELSNFSFTSATGEKIDKSVKVFIDELAGKLSDLEEDTVQGIELSFETDGELLTVNATNEEGVINSTSVKIPISTLIDKRFPGTESTRKHVRVVTKDVESLMQVSYSGEKYDIPKDEYTIPVRLETGNIRVTNEQWLEDSRDQWNDRNAASIALVKKTHEATFRLPRDHSLDKPWEEKIEDFPAVYIENTTALIPAVDGTYSDGDQTFIFASDYYDPLPTGADGKVKNEATIVMRDYEYPTCICTDLPKKEYHAVPKEYVDGMHLSVELDPSTYVLTVKLVNVDDTVLSEHVIDLPLETMVLNAEVSEDGTKLILTINNAEKSKVEFDIGKLVANLVDEATFDQTVDEIYADMEVDLAKKLDKPTAEWKVPVSQGKDANGNIKYGTMTYTGTPLKSAIPFWSANATLKTNKAVDNDDAVNLAQHNEDLAGKQKKLPKNAAYEHIRVVYGREAKKDSDSAIEIAASRGNWSYHLASYIPPTDCEYSYADNGGTLIVTKPTKPLHAANKQFVEDSLAPIIAELGSIVVTKEEEVKRTDVSVPVFLPTGTRPNIFVEFAKAEMEWTNGTDFVWTSADFHTVIITNTSTNAQRAVGIEQGGFIQLEEGEDLIQFNTYPDPSPPDDSGEWYGNDMVTPLLSYKIIYQVKVGG